MAGSLDSLNVRLIVSADNMSGERLQRTIDLVRSSAQKDRVRVLAGINFNNVGPGWAERAIAQLEADVKAGAVGVGEIPKSFGLSVKKPDGSRLRIDDPELDPIWDACARLNLPVFIHTADPQEFFEPIDYHERAMARAVALSGSPLSCAAISAFRGAARRAGPALQTAPEDDVRCRAPRLGGERPRRA